MSRARLARPMNAVLLFVTVWAACSCGTTTARSAATPSQPDASMPVVAEYPESMRGTWMLGPQPCRLPTSPDADGRFVIEANVISGYEASYKPVRVVPDAGKAGVWHITSIETYLGSQVAEMEHTFILSGTKLIEQDGESRVLYAKCTGKQQGPMGGLNQAYRRQRT